MKYITTLKLILIISVIILTFEASASAGGSEVTLDSNLSKQQQMIFELHQPDENNQRHFRVKDTMSVVFKINENQAMAIDIFKSNAKIDSGVRNQTSKIEELTSVEEIMQLRNTKII